MVNRIYLVILILVFSAGCSINPVTGQQDFVLMSEQEELALGRQHSRQVMKTYRLYDNPALQQYIQSVGDRVARVSHRQSLIYRFTLLDSPQVNAFALPGGYIYITRGLLAYLNSEAELAAVLGHELGHVTARHSVRQHSLSTATHLIGGLIAAASGVQGAGQLSNILGTSIVRGYGREHELEADGLGADYLRKAGYSAAAMRRVIAVLKNQELFDKKLAAEQGREPRAYHGVFRHTRIMILAFSRC
jgi:Putative Zn-dependent protease